MEQKGIVSDMFSIMQLIALSYDLPLNLSYTDSIYAQYLQEKDIIADYQITYLDSLDQVMATAGTPIARGYATDTIPIVNGTKVAATVDITPPVVFRTMFGILLLSVVMLALIIACMFYVTRHFISQQHIMRLRESFTQALTHDMKTPLSSIRTVLDHFQNGTLDPHPELKTRFNAIAIEQCLDLQAMVNQVLTVAYSDQKQLALNRQTLDLPAMMRALIDKFTAKGGKSIEFAEEYDLRGADVYADPLYLSNAVSNLFDNAIKYSDWV
jgi:two-component system phosphate regulon sensor histidine kinase PhoR